MCRRAGARCRPTGPLEQVLNSVFQQLSKKYHFDSMPFRHVARHQGGGFQVRSSHRRRDQVWTRFHRVRGGKLRRKSRRRTNRKDLRPATGRGHVLPR